MNIDRAIHFRMIRRPGIGHPFVISAGIFIVSTLLWPLVVPPAHAQKSLPKPSLDRLVLRAESYWNFLLEGKKLRAVEFVEEASRETFLARRSPAFTNPRLVRLEPAAGRHEVMVTMEVTRSIPPLRVPVEWPVAEKWVFKKGDWYLVVPKGSGGFLAGEGVRATPDVRADEIERSRNAILSGLRFDKTDLDFGTVRRGQVASVTLHYRLAGQEAMDLQFLEALADLNVLGLESRKLQPGGPHDVKFELMTANLSHGRLEQPLTFQVRYRGASVTYRFRVVAQVYAPVSAVPDSLRFTRAEREEEITVSNNSSVPLRIVSSACESAGLEVEPLPVSIPPGGTAQLKVRLLRDFGANHREPLGLHFQEPVEGVSELSLPVVVNPPMDRPQESPYGINPAQIDELLRKSRPPR